MSTNLDALVPELQPYARQLVQLAGSAGLLPRVTSTLRSRSEQERLYRRYQSGLAAFPVAPPGTSAHEYGEAFDIVVEPFDALVDLGATWQAWGGSWGAERDPVHFELPGASAYYKRGSGSFLERITPSRHTLAVAADIILSLQPEIGVVELAAWLVSLGYPESQVLKFLSAPIETTLGY